jgi:hypothetical protein
MSGVDGRNFTIKIDFWRNALEEICFSKTFQDYPLVWKHFVRGLLMSTCSRYFVGGTSISYQEGHWLSI